MQLNRGEQLIEGFGADGNTDGIRQKKNRKRLAVSDSPSEVENPIHPIVENPIVYNPRKDGVSARELFKFLMISESLAGIRQDLDSST